MGLPAARITDVHVCPMVTGTVPHVGGPVAMGCFTVIVGGMPAARIGDVCVCVGPPDPIATGATHVFIGGSPAARITDTTAHGGKIVMGCPTVLIEPGQSDQDDDQDQQDSDQDQDGDQDGEDGSGDGGSSTDASQEAPQEELHATAQSLDDPNLPPAGDVPANGMGQLGEAPAGAFQLSAEQNVAGGPGGLTGPGAGFSGAPVGLGAGAMGSLGSLGGGNLLQGYVSQTGSGSAPLQGYAATGGPPSSSSPPAGLEVSGRIIDPLPTSASGTAVRPGRRLSGSVRQDVPASGQPPAGSGSRPPLQGRVEKDAPVAGPGGSRPPLQGRVEKNAPLQGRVEKDGTPPQPVLKPLTPKLDTSQPGGQAPFKLHAEKGGPGSSSNVGGQLVDTQVHGQLVSRDVSGRLVDRQVHGQLVDKQVHGEIVNRTPPLQGRTVEENVTGRVLGEPQGPPPSYGDRYFSGLIQQISDDTTRDREKVAKDFLDMAKQAGNIDTYKNAIGILAKGTGDDSHVRTVGPAGDILKGVVDMQKTLGEALEKNKYDNETMINLGKSMGEMSKGATELLIQDKEVAEKFGKVAGPMVDSLEAHAQLAAAQDNVAKLEKYRQDYVARMGDKAEPEHLGAITGREIHEYMKVAAQAMKLLIAPKP